MPSQRTARPWTRAQLAIAAAAAIAAIVITLLFALDARDGAAPPGAVVTVSVTYPGASARQLELDVVDPIERAIGQLEGVHALRSTSEPGQALVRVTFEVPRPLFAASQDVQRALAEVLRELPPEAGIPSISTVDPGGPLLVLSLSGPQSTLELSDIASELIKRRLEQLPGIGAIELERASQRRISIRPDLVRLAALGATLAEVEAAVRSSDTTVPGGRLTAGGAALRIDAPTSPEALADLVVVSRDGGIVRLRDVASIMDGTAGGASRPLSITVRAQQGVPRADVRERVHTAIAELRGSLPAGAVLEEAPPPERPPAALSIRLSGPDREVLRPLAARVEAHLRTSGAASSVERTPPAGQPEQRVELDRARIAQLGVHDSDVLATLGAATRATPIASLSTGGRDVPIEIVLDGDLPAALSLLHVRARDGSLVPLSSLVTSIAGTSETLLRIAREPALELSARPAPGQSLSTVRSRATEVTRGLPPGYSAVLSP